MKKRIAALHVIATAGIDIEGFPPKEEVVKNYFPVFRKKVVFFQDIINDISQSHINRSACQIFVGKILHEFKILSWSGRQSPDLAKSAFETIAEILRAVPNALNSSPYPRFVGEFLYHMITNASSFIKGGNTMYNFSLLVVPCIAWGKSELIFRIANVQNLSEVLNSFLINRAFLSPDSKKERRILSETFRSLESMRPCHDFSNEERYPVTKAIIAYNFAQMFDQLPEEEKAEFRKRIPI